MPFPATVWFEKKQQKTYHLFKRFLCDIIQLNSSCNEPYFHTTEHNTRLTFEFSQADNEFSSKYCCVWLIITNNALTYHRHKLNRNNIQSFNYTAKNLKR